MLLFLFTGLGSPPPGPPTWPATIPQTPIYGGFTEQRQPNNAGFAPEVGPPKSRRRSTAVGVPTSATFEMTTAQVATFDTFFETTLADGSLSFTWAHPLTGVSYTWMFAPGEAPGKSAENVDLNRITCKLIRMP